jgi:hypothetical protein
MLVKNRTERWADREPPLSPEGFQLGISFTPHCASRPPLNAPKSEGRAAGAEVIESRGMGRRLVRLTDGAGFTLAGEHVDNGAMLELQLEGDRWIPGTLHWSADTGSAVIFLLKLGGPHERQGNLAPEVHLRLDPTEAWFRFPATSGN